MERMSNKPASTRSVTEAWLAARTSAHAAENAAFAVRILHRRANQGVPALYADSARTLRLYADCLGRMAQPLLFPLMARALLPRERVQAVVASVAAA